MKNIKLTVTVLGAVAAATCFAENAVRIDIGRQLFVDDHLISTTTLQRVWHYPKKYSGNPVMVPETDLEINKGKNAVALPKGGGIWWDEKEKVFKLWYESGWLNAITYATSKDGIKWDRPKLNIVPGTNAVLPLDEPSVRPDSWSVVKDPNPKSPDELYKLFVRHPWAHPLTVSDGWTMTSPDGIHWKKVSPVPPCGDRSSLYYNPFRDTWVFSLRSNWKNPGEKHARRNRTYYEVADFNDVLGWNFEPDSDRKITKWLQADALDLPDPKIPEQKVTQLYNFDAVAYESIMLGMMEIHIGPENNYCEAAGMPKITDLKFAYSRDGKNFKRPDRNVAIASERWSSGKWDAGYVQPVANLCVIMGDELWFYYGAFAGAPDRGDRDGKKFDWTVNNGMYANGSMGIAKMRRDGFASLEGTGELLTKPLHFSGEYLFVNVDAKAGSIAAELLDKDGKVIDGYSMKDSVVEKIDSTKRRITWKNKDRLDVRKLPAYRLRFKLDNAALYAFWISMDKSGASNGYLAGGGPGYAGLIDKPAPRVNTSKPKIAAPGPEYAKSTRRYEGIPSIAVSPKGCMWVTWYASRTPSEDETNYLVLSSSTDGGKTWKEMYICDPDFNGPRRVFDPELWIAPDGKLRWFWTDKIGPVTSIPDNDQLWMATLDPETGAILEEPRIIAKGIMMCKPTVLKDGTWILPVAHWFANPSACVYASTDGGKTFKYRGGATIPKSKRLFDEHCIVEKKDGTLVSFIRTTWSPQNCQVKSESRDGGYTWSNPVPCLAGNVSSRTCVTKLKSGKWVMVKHGIWGNVEKTRRNLIALISNDEGRTWDGGLSIDARNDVSYPDIQQLEDGSIVVVNDHSRTGKREISFVKFREEDIIPARVNLKRKIVSDSKSAN